jgi:hypothetical protein
MQRRTFWRGLRQRRYYHQRLDVFAVRCFCGWSGLRRYLPRRNRHLLEATNNVFYGSAKSYIMEQPWNDSCASTLLANFFTGSPITYGSTGFCNTATGTNFLLAVGGSGGPSACATGAPTVGGVAGGTCAGYAKPSYQSAYIGAMAGLQNDGVRDTPDVSLMAANGLWGHYYLICYSDTTPQWQSAGRNCLHRTANQLAGLRRDLGFVTHHGCHSVAGSAAQRRLAGKSECPLLCLRSG